MIYGDIFSVSLFDGIAAILLCSGKVGDGRQMLLLCGMNQAFLLFTWLSSHLSVCRTTPQPAHGLPPPAAHRDFFQETLSLPRKRKDGACVTDLLPVRLTVVFFCPPQSRHSFVCITKRKLVGIFNVLLPKHTPLAKMYIANGQVSKW